MKWPDSLFELLLMKQHVVHSHCNCSVVALAGLAVASSYLVLASPFVPPGLKDIQYICSYILTFVYVTHYQSRESLNLCLLLRLMMLHVYSYEMPQRQATFSSKG